MNIMIIINGYLIIYLLPNETNMVMRKANLEITQSYVVCTGIKQFFYLFVRILSHRTTKATYLCMRQLENSV